MSKQDKNFWHNGALELKDVDDDTSYNFLKYGRRGKNGG